MSRRIIFISLCILLRFLLMSQSKDEADYQQIIEDLFQWQDEDLNYEDLYESMLIHYANPINMNQTTYDELASLHLLSTNQLNQFFRHIEKQGMLISIYELQAIPGFDAATIKSILPFVTVQEKTDSRKLLERIKSEENNYFLLRNTQTLQKQRGYKVNNGYHGSPNKLYGRYQVSRSHDFSFGFTFEKDAGETFGWDKHTKGFDYYSFHATVENLGRVSKLIVGDYQLQFGQGLVYGAGFGIGKGSETITAIKRNTLGIRRYTGALESGFFRGTATTLSKGKNQLTLCYSRLHQDARLISDTTYSDFEAFTNAIQATGLHRTASERSSKNQLKEQSTGAIYEYAFNPRNKVGVTFLSSFFSSPLQKKPNNYNQHEFLGKQNQISSIYGNFVWKNFYLFGESAISSSLGRGSIIGIISSLTPIIDMSMAIRSYDKDFHSFYGNSLSESSRLINEKAMYWGLKIQPNKKHNVTFYYDQFRFPWLKYRVDAPSNGFEYLARYSYKYARVLTMYVQFRQEHKEVTRQSDQANLGTLVNGIKSNYLINVDYAPSKALSLKTRVQGSSYQLGKEKTSGYALIQDVNFQSRKFSFSTRFAIFETDFINRQYAYEKNVLYNFSVPAYSGTGIRTYVNIHYKASKKLSWWLRMGQFRYQNSETIGSGLSQIEGNKSTEFVAMIRLKFQ